MANIVVAAIAKWNGSALVKGEKQLTNFQKTTDKLAKTFVGLFAAQKIIAFGKASVQAFAADEKAAKSLSIALKNTGNGFATIATEGFIARMQQTYKVLDDELRPAFQTLLTATGSITKAQQGLELALNVSAGTTNDLVTVAKALSRGYAGNTQGLSRLNAGLTKAILKTNDMDKITNALSKRFKGQALSALDTYSKKFSALTVAAENSKEIIGKGLLDSIQALGSDNGITKTANAMETLSQNVADTVLGFALLIGKVKELGSIDLGPNTGKFFGLLAATLAGAGVGAVAGGGVGAIPGAFVGLTGGLTQQKLQAKGTQSRVGNTAYSPTSMYFTAETAERAKLIATLKKSNVTEKEKQKLSAAELADKKKSAELEALKKKFDVDRINIQTALANSTDEAEKARLRGLLTIIDEDANAAGKRLVELDKANSERLRQEYLLSLSLGDLTQAAKYAAMGVKEIMMGGRPISQYDTYKDDPIFQKRLEVESMIALLDSEQAVAESEKAMRAVGISPDVINNITINTPLGTEEVLTEAVQKAVQQLNRYGASTNFAGALQVQL